jgi:hypothetical protein
MQWLWRGWESVGRERDDIGEEKKRERKRVSAYHDVLVTTRHVCYRDAI